MTDLQLLSGGFNMTPIDVSSLLPTHPTKKYKTRTSPPDMIVVHCSDRDWTVEQLAKYDVEGGLTYVRQYDGKTVTDVNHINKNGIPAVTYHSCITKDRVYHTLDHSQISYHAAQFNPRSLAVCMLYMTTSPISNKATIAPPDSMVKLTQCHVAELCLKYGLTPDRVVGHRELKGTGWEIILGRKRLLKTCPGPFVDLDLMRTNIAKYMQVKLKLHNLYDGEIDGDFGPKSRVALNAYKGK